MCMSFVLRDRLIGYDWLLYRQNFFHGAKQTIAIQQNLITNFLFREVSDPDSSKTKCFDELVS